MSKTSSPPAAPRNTATSRQCNPKIRTAIKCGASVITSPLYEASGGSGSNPLHGEMYDAL